MQVTECLSDCLKMLIGYGHPSPVAPPAQPVAQPPLISRCYIVGEPIYLEEFRSFAAGLGMSLLYGLHAGCKKPRIINEDIIRDEALPKLKLTPIFTTYEEALKYLEALSPVLIDKCRHSAAPILTVLLHEPIQAWPTKQIIQRSYKEVDSYIGDMRGYRSLEKEVPYCCIMHKLSAEDITILEAEFPTSDRMETINFHRKAARKID